MHEPHENNASSSPEVEPHHQSVLTTLDAATVEALPFRLHPQLMSIWGEATDKAHLADLIEADGGIRDALLFAEVKGEEDQKPILFDGLTRLSIYFERKAAGKVEPLPALLFRRSTTLVTSC